MKYDVRFDVRLKSGHNMQAGRDEAKERGELEGGGGRDGRRERGGGGGGGAGGGGEE